MWTKWCVSMAALALVAQPVLGNIVEFNMELARSYADNGITFLADVNEIPISALMGMDGPGGEDKVEDQVEAENAAKKKPMFIECSQTTKPSEPSEKVTIILAISKCIPEEDMKQIYDWINSLKTEETINYFKGDGTTAEITFDTVVVPGQCQALDERNTHGLHNVNWDEKDFPGYEGEPEMILMSEEVQESDLKRFAMFSDHGRVLSGLGGVNGQAAIGVVSFVNDDRSFEEVQQFERSHKISKAFNFRICEGGKSCNGKYENCITLDLCADVFMYNPFTVSKCFHCQNLDGGIPVTYVDWSGNRKCYCSCPAGYKMKYDEATKKYYCEQVKEKPCICAWENQDHGYRHEVTEKLEKCEFNRMYSDWKVDVPFPMDNYVADKRINSADGTADVTQGPHVDLSRAEKHDKEIDYATFEAAMAAINKGGVETCELDDEWAAVLAMYQVSEQSAWIKKTNAETSGLETWHYEWKEYQETRQAKIDSVDFHEYGKYSLGMTANDYSKTAECEGCVSIVDKYRPKKTTDCPKGFCDNTSPLCDGFELYTSEMTDANIKTAHEKVDAVYQFHEKAVNDACSIDRRCDDKKFKQKDFYEDDYCDKENYDSGRQCFDTARGDFFGMGRSKTNLLKGKDGKMIQETSFDVERQCTRCCKYKVELKEWWTDYKCGKDYDFAYCSGRADDQSKCAFQQCLTMTGTTMASAGARIKKTWQDQSQTVLDALVQKGFNTETQIHRALQCTSFNKDDPKCTFKAKIKDLIQTKVEANFELPKNVNINDFVFWRYAVEGDDTKWRAFDDKIDHVFSSTDTKISIEAWSNCGIVRRFFFYVHLHLHSDVLVCDYFDDMWYQSTVSLKPVKLGICAYPKSDFAELTFDYHANVGLQYSREKLLLNVSDVACTIKMENGKEAALLHDSRDNAQIVERFAVELVNDDKTKAVTDFSVVCDFTYKRLDKSTVKKTCKKEFTVVDCDGPKFDEHEGECRWDQCAGKSLPGPYEACGGKVVRLSKGMTTVSTSDSKCCDSCARKSVCTPILGLPSASDDIKRCVPQPKPGDKVDIYNPYENPEEGGGEGDYAGTMLMSVAENMRDGNMSVLALVGGTALVALVALVVVKRRNAAAAKPTVHEDAYYPLLH